MPRSRALAVSSRVHLVVLAALLLALLGALVAQPAAVRAKAERFTDQVITLDCQLMPDPAGTLFIFAVLSQNQFSFVDIAFWEGEVTDPSLVAPRYAASGEPPTHSLDGATLTVSVPLVEIIDPETGESVPTDPATISATLAPSGDPVPIDIDEDFHRFHNRVVGTSQPVLASGVVTLPDDRTVAFADCPGTVDDVSVFSTFPNSFVGDFTSALLECDLESPDGTLFLSASGFGGADFSETFASLFFVPSDLAAPALSGFADPHVPDGGTATLTATSFSATFALFEAETREPAGTATAEATLSPSGPAQTHLLNPQHGRVKVTEQALAVEGTLLLPGGITFDLSSCIAAFAEERIIDTPSQGPKPHGRPAPNDTPAGAIGMSPGDSVANVHTAGTAPEPEALAPCPAPPGVAPLGHTVWYTIEGTGGAITVDTAGSDFDTVIAVYEGEGLEPIGCVDDVQLGLTPNARTLQAAITFDSVAGETYYVQIGGFPRFEGGYEFGNLDVSVR